jgi:hypothetical protein
MDEASPPTGAPQHTKEGWVTKLSGYLVKSPKRRYFRLRRNRLAYYRSLHDDVPRRIIQLDGCAVESAPDGSVVLFERTKSPAHRYVIRCDDQQVMTEWVEAIKLASVLYQEIFYAAVVRSKGRELEHCFPHWGDQVNVFRKLAKDAAASAQPVGETVTPRRLCDERHKLYKVCSIASGSTVFVCVVAKKLAAYKPEAFLEDARETFQSMTSLSAGEGIAPGEEDFERKLRQMMQVYSPGYPDAKAPELVVNANRWLKKVLAGQGGNPQASEAGLA